LETTSKQTLKRMMNEKMDIQNKHEDLKRSLNQSEEEAEITRDKLARSEKTVQKLLDVEQKLRIDLTKRIAEANLDKERLSQMENLLLQEKQKFNLPNSINFLLNAANNGHLSDDDIKAVLLALKPPIEEKDSTSEFESEEKRNAELMQLESVIKSQASNLASFFDELPVELGLTQFSQIVSFVRESNDKLDSLQSEKQCFIQEIDLAKIEKEHAEAKLTRLTTDHKSRVIKLEQIITEKDASLKGINLTLESVQDSVKKFSPMDDQKSQIIMVLASFVVLLLALLMV